MKLFDLGLSVVRPVSGAASTTYEVRGRVRRGTLGGTVDQLTTKRYRVVVERWDMMPHVCTAAVIVFVCQRVSSVG